MVRLQRRSVAVLLACLHLQAYVLGIVTVAAFSIGLALTMVAVGAGAAWGANAAMQRFGSIERLSKQAPYISVAIMLVVGLIAVFRGLQGLSRG